MEEVELSLASMSCLVLVCLRLGLFERDLANHFNVSVSTVYYIYHTWIRFMYLIDLRRFLCGRVKVW